ncbi:MAG: class I SAM-dependent methyltransferase [Thermodesulfobacteriota bacterium]|nr:class I SAM-dependent methyltransferase [Thermodesulfobacteriota bacterium]
MIRIDPIKYESWFNKPIGRYAEMAEKRLIARFLQIKPGARILDIGCGTGRFTAEYLKRGARVYGLDSSPEMIEYAGRKHRGIEFKVGKAEALPYPDNHFDSVVIVTTLEFATDPQKVLAEIRRILKPDGILLAGVLNRSNPWTVYRRLRGLFGHPIWSKAHFFSGIELKELLVRSNFGDIHSESTLFGAFILFKGVKKA